MPLSDKKLEKLHKTLGNYTAVLDTMSPDDLKKRILGAETEMKNAIDEMEANKEFVAADEVVKTFKSGLAPINKNEKAVISYALHLLEEKGLV